MTSRKFVIISVLLILISVVSARAQSYLNKNGYFDQIMPVKALQWERAFIMNNLVPYYDYDLISPEGDFFPEAEFDPYYAVLVQWPSFTPFDDSLFEYFSSMTLEIAKVSKVFMIVSTEVEKEYYKEHLINEGADPEQLIFFIINTDSIWSRDFGPQYIFDSNGNATMIDLMYYPTRFFDDIIPRYIESYTNISRYELPLYFEGGNLMADGVNTCSYNEGLYLYNQNYSREEIDLMMEDYCGCERKIVLPLDNGYNSVFFHIDLAAKFLTTNKVMIAETSPDNIFYDYLENIAQIFSNTVDCDGNPYEIVRMPTDFLVEQTRYGEVYIPKSYLNSLIINEKVIVPLYNEAEDEDALDIYRNAMPGYEVVGVDSTSIYAALGAVHCTTKGIPRIPLSVGLSTDKEEYNIGEIVNVRLSAHVPTQSVTCDIYITVNTPDGKVLYYPTWSETKSKVLSEIHLPKDLELYTVELFKWDTAGRQMPLSTPGLYKIQSYMTDPGKDEIMGISHIAEIEVYANCPSGMIFIPDSNIRMNSAGKYFVNLSNYCIDKFEYPNIAMAKPQNGITWFEANSACQDEGKRLCTEAEWENACKGISDFTYPYGYFHKIGICPDYANGIQPSGSYPQCTGYHNVYDMSGNLWEWVSDWMGTYPTGVHDNPTGPNLGVERILRGGDFWGAMWNESSCTNRKGIKPEASGVTTGFRCCSDTE